MTGLKTSAPHQDTQFIARLGPSCLLSLEEIPDQASRADSLAVEGAEIQSKVRWTEKTGHKRLFHSNADAKRRKLVNDRTVP